jgi:hypothetical protein
LTLAPFGRPENIRPAVDAKSQVTQGMLEGGFQVIFLTFKVAQILSRQRAAPLSLDAKTLVVSRDAPVTPQRFLVLFLSLFD